MWSMPFGSFNPSHYGFWLAIVGALVMGLSGDFVMAKLRQKYGNSDHPKD
jgi:hypothetical protein